MFQSNIIDLPHQFLTHLPKRRRAKPDEPLLGEGHDGMNPWSGAAAINASPPSYGHNYEQ